VANIEASTMSELSASLFLQSALSSNASSSLFSLASNHELVNKPRTIPPITTAIVPNNDAQFKVALLVSPKMSHEYTKRLTGRKMIENIVDVVVIAIESARSTLKREHHQFEYDPPGEERTMRRERAYVALRLGVALMTTKPTKGIITNWQKRPIRMPVFFSTLLRTLESLVEEDIP
jgi:hypothetical protein